LPKDTPVHVKEKGVLSELAKSINKTSEILQNQREQLRNKDTARANWIAGVSHDIRTPLSMIMGYTSQLKTSLNLSDETDKKLSVILKQSERIKNLINDLNLASKLEYNMQPFEQKKENVVAVVRQVVVDFLNMDIDESFGRSDKTLEEAKYELQYFKDNYKAIPNYINFYYIGKNDRIIPASKVEKYCQNNNIAYELIACGHYPFSYFTDFKDIIN